MEMFVNVPYIRERIAPLGDSFRIRLRGFRSFHLTDKHGRIESTAIADLSRSGIEINSTESKSMPVKVATSMGYVILDFDAIERFLDTGEQVAYETVLKACSEYWDEWETRGSASKQQ
ncbi:MAG: hypothetical protein HYV95_03430 [Opitutae bacterium]|nr:hypothetical protein [Opitutae bacterium]